MKIKFTIITVFLFRLLINAQAFQIDKPAPPIDSLEKVLPLLCDSASGDCLNELTRSYAEVEKRKNEKHRRELAENELQIQKLKSDKTTAELHRQAIELEMQAPRAQMNPHFVFNCLSSINRFILKNEAETIPMTTL